jgi:hypothetical protein
MDTTTASCWKCRLVRSLSLGADYALAGLVVLALTFFSTQLLVLYAARKAFFDADACPEHAAREESS